MPLTPEQQQHVARHLNTRSRTPKCPVCAASNLRVLPDLIERTSLASEEKHPAVVVECGYCGHLMHFSPSVLELETTNLR
jgi:RNase P subunit RPR2